MHWYRRFRALASSDGAKTTNFFRIFTSSLSGTSAFVSLPLPLLALGGMVTARGGGARMERVWEAAGGWGGKLRSESKRRKAMADFRLRRRGEG
jgi:hypothetical protein